jgi:hypothetical protein
MSNLPITNIVGANVAETTKRPMYEVGAKGRTTDGRLCQYVQVGSADIAAGADVAFDANGKAITKGSSDTKVGKAFYAMTANEYGFIALVES